MKRPFVCEVCYAKEGPSIFANDPWCSDTCHKKLAESLGVPQGKLTPAILREALERQDKAVNPGWDFAREVKNSIARHDAKTITYQYGYQSAVAAMHWANPQPGNGARR